MVKTATESEGKKKSSKAQPAEAKAKKVSAKKADKISETHSEEKQHAKHETSAHAAKIHHEEKHTEHKVHEEHKHVAEKTAEHKTHEEHKNKPAEETHAKKHKEIVQPEINIGMIGHVDHGKTSLTKALTGKWCDTHSEEVKRGISIRLGYADVTFYKLKTNSGAAYWNAPEYQGKPAEVVSKRIVSFVDAPGHETLMTTMLSGAALMNGAVLVIAANEMCPQPRTIEHLMALKFAGVEKVVVAQNKVDLITKEQAIANYKAIRKFMDSYGYKDAPIVPTAATFGVNIDALIEAIETYIPTPHFDESKPLKMFVARSFDINKPGTKTKDLKGSIIGGSIAQGTVNVGDEIELYPGLGGSEKTITKVMSIATDDGLMQKAHPGGLLAIGTALDPSIAQNDQLRGQIAAKAGSLPVPVKDLRLKVHMFERMTEQNVKEKNMIKVTDALVVTIGTNTAIGFVTKSDPKETILNLKNVVVAEKGEKVALSKNIAGQWRLIAYAEVI
ncbi:Translation initiation factor 2 subunit gamma [uncultured archaeon]|nr:Translation initiation factor 2 subunit gamma [uncultured archaeon]